MGFLSRSLGLSRVEADDYYQRALSAYQRGKYEDAVEQIELAITLLPQNAEYYAVRGLFHLENDDAEQAREGFQQALSLHTGEAVANYGMGRLCFRDKKWAQALGWLNKVRMVNPTLAEAPYYMALVYHRQRDNATAQAFMKQALALMEDQDDKRKKDAKAWLTTFEELIEEEETAGQEVTVDADRVRVNQQALKGGRAAGQLGDGQS